MTRYWVISPAEYSHAGRKAAWYRTCWEYDLAHKIIAIGWNLGEAPESPAHLEHLWEMYADPTWTENARIMVEKFYFGIEDGDLVVARAGMLRYVGLGEFQGDAYYDPSSEGRTWGCNVRKVEWAPDRTLRRSPVGFSRSAVYELRPNKARLFNW